MTFGFQGGGGGSLIIPNKVNDGSNPSTIAASTSIFNTFLSASPRYGIRYKDSSQTIASGATTAINWNDLIGGPLTSNGVTYTNSTGSTLIVLINYTVLWDPALGGGAVSTTLVQGASDRQHCVASVFPTTYNATCTGSTIISMANTTTVQLVATNNLGGGLDVRGGGPTFPIVSRMTYYILN